MTFIFLTSSFMQMFEWVRRSEQKTFKVLFDFFAADTNDHNKVFIGLACYHGCPNHQNIFFRHRCKKATKLINQKSLIHSSCFLFLIATKLFD